MTAEQLLDVLPKQAYPDLTMLAQDIQRALRQAFPGHEKIERQFEPYKMVREPGKPLDAMISFHPQDAGQGYYIRIVAGKVDKVFPIQVTPL